MTVRFGTLLLAWTLPASTTASVAIAEPPASATLVGEQSSITQDPQDPSNLRPNVERRGKQLESLLPVSPLGGVHDAVSQWKKDIYDATYLDLVFVYTQVFQTITNAQPRQDRYATAATTDYLATWDVINQGQPTEGQAVAHLQGRWDYGPSGPEDLGFVSLASGIGTADTFSAYKPATFVLRNLYWRQGSPEAGWAYRLGKITPDGIFSSSAYLDSQTTFLPSGGVSSLAIAFPDSGLGAVGGWYVNDRLVLAGGISDANGDRFNFGDLTEGDLFKVGEIQFKIAPQTPKAGYSKLTVWHTDGTKDGTAINAMTGRPGWGFYAKLENELTSDGRVVGILRYGKSFNDSAFYEQQASAHLLFQEPRLTTRLKNDLIGVAVNWAQPSGGGARSEYNIEVFYRFPVFPHVDTTLSYQSVINPAFTREIDHASVFSLRIRTTF